MDKSVSEYLARIGQKGGKKGGKSTSPKKLAALARARKILAQKRRAK